MKYIYKVEYLNRESTNLVEYVLDHYLNNGYQMVHFEKTMAVFRKPVSEEEHAAYSNELCRIRDKVLNSSYID